MHHSPFERPTEEYEVDGWIQELADMDDYGNPKLRLQYSQVVMLNFFRPREDEFPDRAVWPLSASPLWRSSRPTIRSYRLRARIFGRASVADRGEAAEAAPSPPLA
jgi:hypothetical protein